MTRPNGKLPESVLHSPRKLRRAAKRALNGNEVVSAQIEGLGRDHGASVGAIMECLYALDDRVSRLEKRLAFVVLAAIVLGESGRQVLLHFIGG